MAVRKTRHRKLVDAGLARKTGKAQPPTEKSLRDFLMMHMKGHWTPIETATMSGFPDVLRTIDGRTDFIELKTYKPTQGPILRAAQVGFMANRLARGGAPTFIITRSTTSKTLRLYTYGLGSMYLKAVGNGEVELVEGSMFEAHFPHNWGAVEDYLSFSSSTVMCRVKAGVKWSPYIQEK